MSWLTRPATRQEMKFAYSCEEGDKVCKCIGHLRGDFGRSGDGFWASWFDHNPELKTQEFKIWFDKTINRLRDADKQFSPLANRRKMSSFCRDYSEASMDDGLGSYCFRTDGLEGEDFSLILRMNPNPGMYNVYCYCYRTEDLENGISDTKGEDIA